MASQQFSVFVLTVIFVCGITTVKTTEDQKKYHETKSPKNDDTATRAGETGLQKARNIFLSIPSHPALAPTGVMALEDLVEAAKHWCFIHGVVTRSMDNYSKDSVVFIPFTLLPSPYPKSLFDKLMRVTPLQSLLLHRAAHDYEFLTNTLRATAEADDFTKRLFNIYETVHKEGMAQEYSIGLFRSDYMIDDKDGNLSVKQIETQTVVTGFSHYGHLTTSLHKFVLERLQRFDQIPNLPKNDAGDHFGAGLAQAWSLYNKPDAIILVVLGEQDYFMLDHRGIELGIYKENPRITIFGRTFAELADGRASLNEKGEYFVDGKEVAVIYFREGVEPQEFRNEAAWQVRLDLERSKALKCPSLQYVLVGTKKVQQELSKKEVLSRFLSDDEIKEILPTYTGLYSLDLNPDGDKAAEMAMQKPMNFVLKPSTRDGGENNYFGTDIPKVLSKIGRSKERSGYILMDRINPPSNSNYIVRPFANKENLIPKEINLEVGIIGVIIGSKDRIVRNTASGYFSRARVTGDNEAGIMRGHGGMVSPLLYE